MNFEFYQFTTAGDRESNQDCMANLISDDFALLVVADGLGGHQAGEKASRYFCQGLLQLAENYAGKMSGNPEKTIDAWVDGAIEEMKKSFSGDPDASQAHTTCAILYVQDDFLLTVHCGDSRIYRMNAGEICWRTRDHSVPQRLLDQGQISEQEMGTHPEQNQLTQSISIMKTHRPEIHVYPPPQQGDTFILCSDGFWEYTKQHEFLRLASPGVTKNIISKQIKLSYLRASGHSDNITVQWLRVN